MMLIGPHCDDPAQEKVDRSADKSCGPLSYANAPMAMRRRHENRNVHRQEC